MGRNIIIHINEVNEDGEGDFVYLLHWLKLFKMLYKGRVQQRLILRPDNLQQVTEKLRSLFLAEPTHPVFQFLKINEESNNIYPIERLGCLEKSNVRKMLQTRGVREFFSDIKDSDNVTLFRVSLTSINLYKNSISSIPVDRQYVVNEFGALTSNMYDVSDKITRLGLGANDLGLLHDIEEDIAKIKLAEHVNNMSAKLRSFIFGDSSIDDVQILRILTHTPIVQSYLPVLSNKLTLIAAYNSQIIQTAIKKGRKPIFIATPKTIVDNLPPLILDAIKKGLIRFNSDYLPDKDFRVLRAIVMHASVKSITICSGDNSLTDCIKYGKLPLYAHKVIPEMLQSIICAQLNKYSIFSDIAKIILANCKQMAWNSHQGIRRCLEIVRFYADANSNFDNHPEITEDAIEFFQKDLAPFIMQNYDFQLRTWPGIEQDLPQDEFTKKSSSTTPMYTKKQADSNAAKPETAGNTRGNNPTIKPGFLNN